jgi:hypothetical protein
MGADEKAAIETAIKDAEAVLKDGDKAAIEARTEALAKASQKLGEKVYAETQGAAGAGGAEGGTARRRGEEGRRRRGRCRVHRGQGQEGLNRALRAVLSGRIEAGACGAP